MPVYQEWDVPGLGAPGRRPDQAPAIDRLGLDGLVQAIRSGSLTSDAIMLGAVACGTGLDAVIAKTQAVALGLDSAPTVSRMGGIAVDAAVSTPEMAVLRLDAWIIA